MSIKQVSPAGLSWYQYAKFGMFIHWGLYSLIAHGEWVMFHEKIAVSEYEKLTSQFNPIKFNADEWVSIAADAGQKYMVITSRHHDGFSMYDTALSDYKITNTPFKRDPLRELADACARRGDVKLGFYSSLLDWHHPAYRFRKESGLAWSDYIGFLHGQVRELCTNYGKTACIWFDGDWPRANITPENSHFAAGGSFEYEKLYNMIHMLQPDAIVHNNRHCEPLPGEDVQGFEQDLPGQNTAGFNATETFKLPLEVSMTINDSWGINSQDENHKSSEQLVHILARCASNGANYLLNVGPTALGEILPVHVNRLKKVGEWLSKNSESIYGTQSDTLEVPACAVATRKADVHYLHVLDYISDSIILPTLPDHLQSASTVENRAAIKMSRLGSKGILTIPPDQRNAFDTVIKLA